MEASRLPVSRILSPASTRIRVFPVASSAAFPELPLASTQNLTMAPSLTYQNTPNRHKTERAWNVFAGIGRCGRVEAKISTQRRGDMMRGPASRRDALSSQLETHSKVQKGDRL